MSTFGRNNISTGDYARHRLNYGRDDRCDKSKKDADAYLRGRIGITKANRIIAAIDKIKSTR